MSPPGPCEAHVVKRVRTHTHTHTLFLLVQPDTHTHFLLVQPASQHLLETGRLTSSGCQLSYAVFHLCPWASHLTPWSLIFLGFFIYLAAPGLSFGMQDL